MDLIKPIAEGVGAIAILFGLAFALAKLLLAQLFKKELESHKIELQGEANRDLERLKADLSSKAGQHLETLKAELQTKNALAIEEYKSTLALETVEHKVRFEKLHDLIMNRVIDLFTAIENFRRSIANIVWPIDVLGITPEKIDAAMNAFNRLHETLQGNKLFLPKDVFDLVNEFIFKVRPVIALFHFAHEENERSPAGGSRHELEGNKVARDAIPMLDEIFSKLQQLLGIRPLNQLAKQPRD